MDGYGGYGRHSTRRAGKGAAASIAALSLVMTAACGPGTTTGHGNGPSVPVYDITQEGLTVGEAGLIAQTFAVPNALQPNGAFSFADSARFEHVPTIAGPSGLDEVGRPVTAEALDVAALRQLTPPADDVALGRADQLLTLSKLSPDLEAKPVVTHAELTLADGSGNAGDTYRLDTSVTYTFRLAGLPVTGQGASLRMSLDQDAAVTQLSQALRRLKRAAKATVISGADARSACSALYPPDVRQEAPVLGYHLPALTADRASGAGTAKKIYPVYTCQPVGPQGVQSGRLVPAVAGSGPRAEVNASRRGDNVTASVTSASGGSGPYTFTWSSSSTVLPSGESTKSVSYTRQPRDPAAPEQVSIQITDANGLSATATVSLPGDGAARAKTVPGGGGLALLANSGVEQTVDEWQCAQDSGNGFHNEMASHGVDVKFDWRGADAWQSDFVDPTLGGDDSNWADSVDAQWYTGHGWPGGFTFKGNHASTTITPSQARWGNGNLEWLQLESCSVLADTTGTHDYFGRWGPSLDGLHMLNGFHTTASCVDGGTGAAFAGNLFPLTYPFVGTVRPALTVRQAWASMATAKEPAGTVFRSMGPMGPGNVTNINDYFWGQGPTGADISAAQKIGYWAIVGTV